MLIFFVVTLTACARTDFDKSIIAGKEALKVEDYQEAIKHFDLALINQPTNKDAMALMKRATESLEVQKLKTKYKEFIDEANSLYNLLASMGIRLEPAVETLTVEMARKQLPAVEELKMRAHNILSDNNDDANTKKIADDLY